MSTDPEKPYRSPVKGLHWYLRRHKYLSIISTIICLFIITFLSVDYQLTGQLPNDNVISLYEFEEGSRTVDQDEEIAEIKEVATYSALGGNYHFHQLEIVEEEGWIEAEAISPMSLSMGPVSINATTSTSSTSTTSNMSTAPTASATMMQLDDAPRAVDTAGIATHIWSIMQDYGWDQVISAGILGNMMAEVGGHTFDLVWDADTGGYYGLCMWAKKYFPNIVGLDVDQQLEFLRNDLDMSIFKSCKTPEEAALAFAKQYERCSSRSYRKRQQNARIAYNTFA